MNKTLLIVAGLVAAAIIGYLIYMYVLMPAGQM